MTSKVIRSSRRLRKRLRSANKLLDPILVHKALEEEFGFIRRVPVWEECARLKERPKAHPGLDGRPIETRWVLVNKGDDPKPIGRARRVAQEVKTYYSVAGHDPTLFFSDVTIGSDARHHRGKRH